MSHDTDFWVLYWFLRQAKKNKKRKLLQKLKQSEKVEKESNPEKNSVDSKNKELAKKDDGINISNSNMTGSSHSSLWSSSSSSLSLNSRSLSDTSRSFRSNSSEFKPKQDNMQGNGKGHTSTIGLCLVLVSLMVLVLWGKVCAILCTSTWLFLVPRCSKARINNLSQKILDYEGIDSKEYKKMIIMEGLLERSRNHVL